MRYSVGLGLALAAGVVSAQGISQKISPQPAEMMPLADQSVLLDVTDTGERLVAVGERGHVVVSLDGETWVQAPTPVRSYLTAVDFADPMNGLAVGHDSTILRTRDGGRSWVLQNFQPVEEPEMDTDMPFLDVLMLDPQTAWAVGAYGRVYTTSNGGESWEEFVTGANPDGWHFNALTRLNNGDLFLAGEQGTLALSQDAGQTWEAIDSPYGSTFFTAAPVGESGVFIAGLRGNAYFSPDVKSGQWQRVETGGEESIIHAEQLADGEIVMVGINGVVLRTRDALQEVESLPNPQGITLASVMPLKEALLVVGNAGPQLIITP